MINLLRKEDCCGCNVCGDICPKDAIIFRTDEEGFWYPSVDENRCIDCNFCNRVCPIENKKSLNNNYYATPVCYAANHKNLKVRFDSTSGGAFSALAEYVFEKNGYVGGAVFTKEWDVKQIVTNNYDDLVRLRSSKYVQSNAEGYYKSIKLLLDKGEFVMAVGLPCQITALRLYLRKEYDNLLLVDLICLYINSPLAYRKYLDSLERNYNSQIIYIKAKNKELGWRNLTHKVVFENESTYYGIYEIDTFLNAGMKAKCISRPHCYECNFKGFPRPGDITLGDYWNNDSDMKLDDDTGTSVVMLNSPKGEKFFELISRKLNYVSIDLDNIIKGNPALIKPIDNTTIDRSSFFERIMHESFEKVVTTMCYNSQRLTVKRKVKNLVKTIIKQLKFSQFRVIPNFKFIYFNFLHPAVHTSVMKGHVIYIRPRCDIEISRKADMRLNGFLELGASDFKYSKLETRFRMERESKLIINESGIKGCTLTIGNTVEILDGGCLVLDGGIISDTGVSISCKNKIKIGQMTSIGKNTIIRDHNYGHLMNIDGYIEHGCVIIGAHVWISDNSTILQEANIGDGAVIMDGTIVNSQIAPHSRILNNQNLKNNDYVEWKM